MIYQCDPRKFRYDQIQIWMGVTIVTIVWNRIKNKDNKNKTHTQSEIPIASWLWPIGGLPAPLQRKAKILFSIFRAIHPPQFIIPAISIRTGNNVYKFNQTIIINAMSKFTFLWIACMLHGFEHICTHLRPRRQLKKCTRDVNPPQHQRHRPDYAISSAVNARSRMTLPHKTLLVCDRIKIINMEINIKRN